MRSIFLKKHCRGRRESPRHEPPQAPLCLPVNVKHQHRCLTAVRVKFSQQSLRTRISLPWLHPEPHDPGRRRRSAVAGHQAHSASPHTVCGTCGRAARTWYDRRTRRARDLPCGDLRISLEFDVRRVDCRRSGGANGERLAWLAMGTTTGLSSATWNGHSPSGLVASIARRSAWRCSMISSARGTASRSVWP